MQIIYRVSKTRLYCFADPLCSANTDCTGTELCTSPGTNLASCGKYLCALNYATSLSY